MTFLDGLVGNNSKFELKCPFSIRDYPSEIAYEEKKIKYLKKIYDKLVFKQNHNYFNMIILIFH